MNVKIYRIKNNIKQIELANMLGISRRKLYEIEKGNYKNISIQLANSISKILEVPVVELFDLN